MLEIPVLGRKIGVRFVSDKELSLYAKEADLLGCYDANKTILLSSSIPLEQAKSVLCHELMHALLTRSGLSNVMDEKLEEAICDASESLLEMFRDAELVKFLANTEEQD